MKEKNIQFNGLRITNCEYNISNVEDKENIKKEDNDGELGINVNIALAKDNPTEVQCILKIKTKSKIKDIIKSVNLECVGYFKTTGLKDEKDYAKILRHTAISTIYPYIRTYISSLTGLDFMYDEIVLPIINVSALD